MKIATWNVNGIRSRETQLLEWVESTQPDVICLQELKAKVEQIPGSLSNLPGYVCYWHGAGAYSGVSLNIRQDAITSEVSFSHPTFDRETRVVEARIGDLCIASVYVPNGGKDYDDKLLFMHEMREWVAARLAETNKLVICGDLNITRSDLDIHYSERDMRKVGQRPDERQLFEAILDRGLVDVTRAVYPDADDFFTWWAPWREHKQRNIGWRIDYILASAALTEKVVRVWNEREVGTSDHGPLLAEFDI